MPHPSCRLFIALVFVVVAVETQQFPVADVRRVIVMVEIAMVDRELLQILAIELTGVTTVNLRMESQRLLAVVAFALFSALPGGW